MTQPVKNECSPSNVYGGGFTQTLFLGCSVSSFSASAGLNEQISELTVQLVEDSCASPDGTFKRYYDEVLEPQEWTDPDPGFYGLTLNIIGAPVYFRVGNFEFSGLVQSWEESYSESGFPTYTVKIVDPRQILENCQLIINDYAGSVENVPNLINVFGFAESFGDVSCPELTPGVDGPIFGSPAGAFGGANVNHNGMQWNNILGATRLLLCMIPATSNIWSPFGRLLLKAPSSVDDGMGLMVANGIINAQYCAYYLVDLNEMPVAPDYWRIDGTNVGLLDIISKICQDAGMDYYIELVPVVSDGVIFKFIKVRTIDRVSAPALNNIETFVTAPARSGLVVNYNKGKEFRNEVTSSFVIGGNKQTFYQAVQDLDPENDGDPTPDEMDDMIVPYFGIEPDSGDVLVPYKDTDGFWEIELPCKDLKQSLAFFGLTPPNDTVVINEKEMMAAQSGFDVWFSYASEVETDLYVMLELNGMKGVLNNIEKVLQAINDNADLRDIDFLNLMGNAFKGHDSNVIEIIQAGFAWIKKIVDQYYGRMFQVRVPYVCARKDEESKIILTSEQPSDGGWTEETSVLGLTNPGILTDFFRLDDNRLGAFCLFNTADEKDIFELSPEDFVVHTASNKLFIKVNVEPEYVYLDKETVFSPRAVISLNTPIRKFQEDEVPLNWKGIAKLLELAGNLDGAEAKNKVISAAKKAGAKNVHVPWINQATMPDAVGIGIKSNILTYGPWGSVGVAGGVEVVHDQGLVPWEYDGYTTLNDAGESIASEKVTNSQVFEAGSVTVVGYPDLPLGAELLAADDGNPFFNGLGVNLVENRSLSTSSYLGSNYGYVTMVPWTGTYGPNVTGLTTQVTPQGLTTTYSMRVWTPKFGRFQRGNAERLKQIAQNRMNFAKTMRAMFFQKIKHATIMGIGQRIKEFNLHQQGALGKEAASPHAVLVGQLMDWNNGDFKRPIVESYSPKELPVELKDDYDKKAIMSLDGIFRPVATSPTADLPGFATPISNCQVAQHRGGQPPVASHYNLDITIDYLNPWAIPDSSIVSERCNTSVGHDIEVMARSDSGHVEDNHLCLPIAGYQSGDASGSDYDSDQRGIALKGPILLHAWGYDTDGFPVPNVRDTDAENGNFSDGPLEHKFADDWLRNCKTWPVAPVDLRYDRHRGVWTIPQYRPVKAKLEADLTAHGSATAIITPDYSLYKSDGSLITSNDDKRITVYDKVGKCLPAQTTGSPTEVIARYNEATCQYEVIESPGPFLKKYYCEESLDSNKNGIPMNIVQLATGIDVDVVDACTIKLYSSHMIQGPTGDGSLFETLKFGSGFIVSTDEFDPCTINVELSGVNNSGVYWSGCADECYYNGTGVECGGSAEDTFQLKSLKTGQGIKFRNTNGNVVLYGGSAFVKDSNTCVKNDDTITANNNFKSQIFLCRGLAGKDSVDGCSVDLGAGVQFEVSETCYNTSGGGDLYDPESLFSKFAIGKGLRFEALGFCDVGISAGVNLYKTSNCITGSTDVGFANSIGLGKGLWIDNNVGNSCEAIIGAGFTIGTSTDCVIPNDVIIPEQNSLPHSSLIAGKGLILKHSEDCEALIGLDLQINGDQSAEITFGDCFDVATDECSTTVNINGFTGNVDTFTGVSGVAITSSGIDICFYVSRLEYSCGLLKDVHDDIDVYCSTIEGTECT